MALASVVDDADRPVSQPRSGNGGTLADIELAAALAAAMQERIAAVTIDVSAGIVTLDGTVRSRSERARIVRVVRSFPGVVAIVDCVRVSVDD